MKLVPTLPGKVNVLLVDDQQRNLDALAAVLASPAYNLVKITSGAEALAELSRHDFAVILLDLMMPGMDGFETAQKVRAGFDMTPIIFVTAVGAEMDFIYRAFQVGAVDYATKPLDPAIVRAKVAIFVELFQARELLKVQLHDSQTLCAELERERSEERKTREYLIARVQTFTKVFEGRLEPEVSHLQNLSWIRKRHWDASPTLPPH